MSDGPVYATEQDPASDSDFAPGELHHLLVGNRGRLLDPRRTPVTVRGVAPRRGSFTVRIDAFEDAGANWELGLEEIERFQFALCATLATGEALAELRYSAGRFDRDLAIDCTADARERTLPRLRQSHDAARAWLVERTGELGIDVDVDEQIERREGHPALYALLVDYMASSTLRRSSASSPRTW